MPAPVPINILHDDPGLLIALASAAGQAGYGNQQQARADDFARMQYQGQLSRMASNDAFVQNELTRRDADTRYQNEYGLRQQQMAASAEQDSQANELQSAYKNAILAQHVKDSEDRQRNDTATLDLRRAELEQRKNAQRTGSTIRGNNEPLTLVPAEGALPDTRLQPVSRVTGSNGSETVRYGSGDMASFGADANDSDRQFATQELQRQIASRPEMVSSDARSQMDFVRSMQNQLPPNQYEAMLQVARSGKVKMDQLVDDTRQLIPKLGGAGRMTATDRKNEGYTAEASELAAIGRLPFKDQAQYARRRFGMQDPDIYTDDDAVAALESRETQIKALTTPITNSGGSSPTGGNVLPAPKSAEDYAVIPPGAWYTHPRTGQPTQKTK